MKSKLLILFSIIFGQLSYSQLITTSPLYPTENDSIIVYFDATQTGAIGLLNYIGTVYTHTGVTTNIGNWQHVIGTWGANATQPALTRLGPNLYQLTIGYPRKFYSMSDASEHITALDFVFRSSDATKQTSPDIFYNLFPTGYTLSLISPVISNSFNDPQCSPIFVSQSDNINVIVKAVTIGTKNSSITLFLNGIQKTQITTDSLNYSILGSQLAVGANQVVVVGIDTSGVTDTVKFNLMINPAITNASLPPGTQLGVNYNSGTSVTLALLAPMKSFVYVLGDFNNWKVDQNYFMNKDSSRADSVVWWVTINNLVPQQEYAYQFLVNGNLRIADPFTHKILDQSNDHYIPSSVYPGLKSYPVNQTSEIVSVLQTGQPAYNWKITNFQKPAKSKLVIYELLVRDFVSTHWYKTIMDTLNYLKNLGVNAIEFMPINEFEGNDSWGYNPSFHLALDKYYGTQDAFKAFVDSAHSKGISVILDVVLNHVFGQNPLVRMYSAGNSPDGSQILTIAGNPYFNTICPNPSYHWGADFNHAAPATQYYVDKVTSYWINEFHVDGFRFDFAKGFTNTYGDGSAYDASRIAIMQKIANKIWQIDSTSILILENFVANAEEQVESNFGFLSWGNMNYNYNEATMGYNMPGHSDLRNAYYGTSGWPKPSLVAYMEDHDEERLMFKNEKYGNKSSYYNIEDTATAIKRMGEAGAFFFTIPGPKMFLQFGELGYDYTINYPSGTGNDRTTDKPIRWDYFNNPNRKQLYNIWAAEISLKENYSAFQNLDSMNVTDSLKTIHLSDNSMKVVVFGNFSVWQSSIKPYFQQNGEWYDYFSGNSVNIAAIDTSFLLNPGEYHIYTSVKLSAPDTSATVTGVINEGTAIVRNFSLSQNYPNPFNPSTVIQYQIPQPGKVTLKIYDMLGREIRTLVNEFQQNGSHSITFDASHLSSGVYFYRIQSGSFIETKKMLLLK
jgi:1,4-alpha-glucan branching enzyme